MGDAVRRSCNRPVNGFLVGGVFRADDVEGTTLDELDRQMSLGGVYVDVHTAAYPGGEIHGQVVRRGFPGDPQSGGETTRR